MKQITIFFSLLFFLFAINAKGQVLANFESGSAADCSLPDNIVDASAITVVDNPDKTGINKSSKVLKVIQKSTFKPWGNGDWFGINIAIANMPLDIKSTKRFLHFKYMSMTVGAQLGFEMSSPKTEFLNTYFPVITTETVGKWQELVIDLSKVSPAVAIQIIDRLYIYPNRSYQSNANTNDQITYFDEIDISDVPPPGYATIADFETDITDKCKPAWGEIKDPYAFEITENPDKTGINKSYYCLKVTQKPDYKPWGSQNWYGIGITFDIPVKVLKNSSNHFLHFKYYSVNKGAQLGIELSDPKTEFVEGKAPLVSLTGKWIDFAIDLRDPNVVITDISKIYIYPNRLYATNGNNQEQITYFDDIEINDVPPVDLPPQTKAELFADFETDITSKLQAAWGEVTDPAAFSIVANPDKTGINPSAKCLKVLHKPTYAPWGNADWYGIVVKQDADILVDKTSNFHYLHLKYLSNTLGATVQIELEFPKIGFTTTVKEVGKWVDVVFDLNIAEFTNTKISHSYLKPNSTYQTNAHTADEITYFDDIVINDQAANPSTGLKAINSNINFSIYPNPATETIYINGTNIAQITIYNLLGVEVLKNTKTENLERIPVSHLKKGIYLLNVTDFNGKSETQKFIIK